MSTTRKRTPPQKPTVFLSHSSANRRELVALKRFLDERAGGSIEFFLSSDDESIPSGKIWPEEVKAALDRMALMLVFISPKALESGWTYFEAGYGLHKLDAANIFCLPGSERDKLPSPFSLIQNRNLHSARELSLLIREINERLEFRLQEQVSRDEFERVFKSKEAGLIELTERLDEIVDTIHVSLEGPPNSLTLFSEACNELSLSNSDAVGEDYQWTHRCSAGIRLRVKDPHSGHMADHDYMSQDLQKKNPDYRCYPQRKRCSVL